MGAGQKVIGVALGHRDSKATERYTHVQAMVVGPLVEARWQRLDRFVATPEFVRTTPPASDAVTSPAGAPDQHA